jgi:hypothetical protein
MTAMTAMTAAPKKENASGQGRAGLGREGLGRAGAGVHRPTRSHASFCLRLYLLVDKESGERRADSGRENECQDWPIDSTPTSPLLHTRCAMTSHPLSSVARTATATATAIATTANCHCPSAFSCLSSFYLIIIIIISSLAFRALHFLALLPFSGLGARRAWIGWALGCIFRHCASPWQMIGIRFSLVMKVTCIFLV